MSLINVYVTDALRISGILPLYQDADAETMTEGIRSLNDMIGGWKDIGIDWGHVETAAGDELVLPEDVSNEVVKYNLAARLLTERQRPIPSTISGIASSRLRTLQMRYHSFSSHLEMDRALWPGNFRRRSTFDFDRG